MVEIDHLIVAGFAEVSGLTVETEIEEYREGGVNDFVHKLVKGTRHVPIVLKRGLTGSEVLWKWHNEVVQGKVTRRSGSIILFDEYYDEHRRWSFEEAYPIKWVGPDLNATSSEVAIEQLELTHNGFKIIK
jgi:phage tail-like protein